MTMLGCGVVSMQPLSMETASGPNVFPPDVLVGCRLLHALQPVRSVGPRLRRLLVRINMHLGARLLPSISILRTTVGDVAGRRTALRRRRKVRLGDLNSTDDSAAGMGRGRLPPLDAVFPRPLFHTSERLDRFLSYGSVAAFSTWAKNTNILLLGRGLLHTF